MKFYSENTNINKYTNRSRNNTNAVVVAFVAVISRVALSAVDAAWIAINGRTEGPTFMADFGVISGKLLIVLYVYGALSAVGTLVALIDWKAGALIAIDAAWITINRRAEG